MKQRGDKQEPQPSIRLAKLGDVGANLYNSFHLLTQIAGLYAEAEVLEHHAILKVVLADLAESAIADLGELYAAWDAVVANKQKSAARFDDPVIGRRIERACARLSRVVALVHPFTPMPRLAAIIGLAEKKWQGFAAYAEGAAPELKTRLTALRAQSETRAARLSGLVERLKKERDAMAEADRVERGIAKRGA